MAAGRHGVHNDHEVRERDLYYVKEEYNHNHNHNHNHIHIHNHNHNHNFRRRKERSIKDRVKVRVRQKDIREREATNDGEYHSSSSTSDSMGHVQFERKPGGGISVRMADREPGELSSGSESDGTEASEPHVRVNGARSPLDNKKRKFSPIVWDIIRGKKQSSVSSNFPLPPPPALPPGEVLPTSPNSFHVAPRSAGSVLLESPNEERFTDHEPGQLDEEDYVTMRNISSSRWVADERSSQMSMDTRFKYAIGSPEIGELSGEVSEVHSISDSEEGRSMGSTGEDKYKEIKSLEDNIMEVDKGDLNDNVSHHSDTDLEENNERILPPQRSIDMLKGCRSVDEFERLNKIDEGTYGVVYRAKDRKTGEIVALKKVKMEKEREGFPMTSLREINILLSFHHSSIVDVKEVVVGSNLDSIFMVMEYMEHDLKGLMEMMKQPYTQSEVKCLMLQLLEGVKYLHDNWVLHRDLKTSNLLLNNRGELKICDFGLSRQYGIPLKPYTHLVVTLWYRAPELLLGAKQYSTAIDMWSLGCIMAELLAKEPLFSGKNELDQLDKIFRTLGTPNEQIWPGYSKLPSVKVNFVKQPYNKLRDKFPPTSFSGRPTLSEAGFDLLNKLLTYDPEKRITAEAALKHEWFREVPLPKLKDFMPTFPAQHAQDRRLRRIMKSPDPLEEQRRKELRQGELGTGSLFG